MAKKPRGIRNNNPGNIRKGPSRWRGLAPEQTDPAFCQFVSPEYGIRALAKVLISYQRAHGAKTITDVIRRWAPSSENDTASYIAGVARETGRHPTKPYDFTARPELTLLARAIIRHENGEQPYSEAVIAAAIDMALSGR